MDFFSSRRSLLAVCLAIVLLARAMVSITSIRLFACSILSSVLFNACAVAQSCPNTTTIGGTSFPSLIDVTTEDLNIGLESGLFTSVDLVNVRVQPSHQHAKL